MRTIDLQMGGRAFTVPQLTIGREQAWRESMGNLLEPLIGALTVSERTIRTPADLASAVRAASAMTDGESMLSALCAYAPELESDRHWLREHAYSDEVAEAVVRLFFGPGRRSREIPTAAHNGASDPLQKTI